MLTAKLFFSDKQGVFVFLVFFSPKKTGLSVFRLLNYLKKQSLMAQFSLSVGNLEYTDRSL